MSDKEAITTFGIRTEKLVGIVMALMLAVMAWAVRVEVRLDKSPTNAAVSDSISKHESLGHRNGATVAQLAELRGQVKELERAGAKISAVLSAIQSSISLLRQDLRELRRTLLRRSRRGSP